MKSNGETPHCRCGEAGSIPATSSRPNAQWDYIAMKAVGYRFESCPHCIRSEVEQLVAQRKLFLTNTCRSDWPGSQMVRRWSAKPFIASSILARASKLAWSNWKGHLVSTQADRGSSPLASAAIDVDGSWRRRGLVAWTGRCCHISKCTPG